VPSLAQFSEPSSRSAIESPEPAGTVRALAGEGYALVPREALPGVAGVEPAGLDLLRGSWERLRPDEYLRDGGKYRFRRHGCFVQQMDGSVLTQSPHRAHWQPMTYNALHGGMQRWFGPLESATAESEAFRQLLTGFGVLFGRLHLVKRWFIEAHQFRIDTAQGIGRPTPEGAHRDGVDFVAVVMVARSQVRGGETRVFQAQGNAGVRFTMQEPWSVLLMDDAKVVHETTPIQPLDSAAVGHRDTLVLTYREKGFQEP
jgi:hypothetical protein